MEYSVEGHKQIFFEEMGSLLKAKRKERNLSVETIVDELKFSKEVVFAMEHALIEKLPNPVYAKGFYRAYSNLLNIDQSIIDAFINTAFVEQQHEPTSSSLNIQMSDGKEEPNTFNAVVDKTHKRNKYKKVVIAILMILLLCFGIIYGMMSNEKDNMIAHNSSSNNFDSLSPIVDTTVNTPTQIDPKEENTFPDTLQQKKEDIAVSPVKEQPKTTPAIKPDSKSSPTTTKEQQATAIASKEQPKITPKPEPKSSPAIIKEQEASVTLPKEQPKTTPISQPDQKPSSPIVNEEEKSAEQQNTALAIQKNTPLETTPTANADNKDTTLPVVQSATNKTSPPVESAPPVKTPKKGVVRIVATGEVWIEVKYNDKTVDFTLQQGQSRSIEFTGTATVKVGDLSAAELYFRRKAMKNLGEKGKVRTYTFSTNE